MDFLTSKSACPSNFASDTPFLRSVRPEMANDGSAAATNSYYSGSLFVWFVVRLVRRSSGSSGSSFVWFVVRLVRSTRHGRKFFWALRAQINF